MIKTSLILSISFFLVAFFGFSQTPKKKLVTKFTSEKIFIDGKLNEEVWKTAEVAKDFQMISPDNGKPEEKSKRTEVKVVYDNEAIYVGAVLYDDPSKIRKELTTRDNSVQADHFMVQLNGYNDGQQEFRFLVSAAGVQIDNLYTPTTGEDFSWNAIWDSHVEMTDYGWVVEMKIPYAAVRFSSEKKQTWGINFYREINRDRQQFTWNLIDNKITNESTQAGILEGIENIETPTRLFLIPYSSYYLSSSPNQKAHGTFKGGLDVKYGINDAFTLDAILVPDFGQTVYDNVVLNLSPFEQQFAENRPFFTEGTDLFNKGGIFYSRRIGSAPYISKNILASSLNSDEEISKYPSTVNLLNALKVSGRTKSGLGIGVLNAVTEKTYADIVNTTSGEKRKEFVSPLTNYNIFVLDQRFRKNSSISLVNTNVTREGSYKDANVSALVWDLNTKKNTYNLNGDFKYSFLNEGIENTGKKTGYTSDLYVGDNSGKYRYGIGGQFVSKDYDPNDFGINYQTHYQSYYGNASYRILKPNKRYNFFNTNINYYTEFDNETGRIQNHSVNINVNTTNKRNHYLGFYINSRPTTVSDFYEPRTANQDRYFTRPRNLQFSSFLSSNYAKKFALDFKLAYWFIDEMGRRNYEIYASPRYRFSDKFSLVYGFDFIRQNNDRGFVDSDANTIFFGRRNVITYSNTLTGKYSINNVMTFNLSVRHYWSFDINKEYYTLQNDGSLLSDPTYSNNNDQNFSTWNLDLTYSWWFAPGSQLTVLYRNNAFNSDYGTDFSHRLNDNASNLLNYQSLNHVLSISVRYFIDYNGAKHWFSKK
ncbi:MAG: DUF5916 domain-containing protein [Flavobacterium sp.]